MEPTRRPGGPNQSPARPEESLMPQMPQPGEAFDHTSFGIRGIDQIAHGQTSGMAGSLPLPSRAKADLLGYGWDKSLAGVSGQIVRHGPIHDHGSGGLHSYPNGGYRFAPDQASSDTNTLRYNMHHLALGSQIDYSYALSKPVDSVQTVWPPADSSYFCEDYHRNQLHKVMAIGKPIGFNDSSGEPCNSDDIAAYDASFVMPNYGTPAETHTSGTSRDNAFSERSIRILCAHTFADEPNNGLLDAERGRVQERSHSNLLEPRSRGYSQSFKSRLTVNRQSSQEAAYLQMSLVNQQDLFPHTGRLNSEALGSSTTSHESQSDDPNILSCDSNGCHSKFKGQYRKGNLQRHKRQKHKNAAEIKIPCEEPGCLKTYKRGDAKLKHLRRHHPGRASAPLLRK